MRKGRFTELQVMAVLRQAEGGAAVPELCRGWRVRNRSSGSIAANNGISTASFYKWRSKYGRMDASMMSQMTSLDRAMSRHWSE